MRKREKLLAYSFLAIFIAATAGIALYKNTKNSGDSIYHQPSTRYGDFLAAQHALYVNDFDTASQLLNTFTDLDYTTVQNTKCISDFLNGELPQGASKLKNEKNASTQLIYDAYLVKNQKWDELYKRHAKDDSTLSAPLRIWASVATKRREEALKFIKKTNGHPSWQSFVTGQIYAITGDTEQAKKSFSKVSPDFINLNDYIYMMSFYRDNNMESEYKKLHDSFTSTPGGMFISDYNEFPAWSNYTNIQNALAFSLLQNVSHSQSILYSDLALLLLRFSQITSDTNINSNPVNYYIGQFLLNTDGNYSKYFDKIDKNSVYSQFAQFKHAEKTQNTAILKQLINKHPLFIPAVNQMIAFDVKNGNKKSALKTVNNAINISTISETGRAFFLKKRAQIHYTFGDYKSAQQDIHAAAKILIDDSEILSLQSKIWVAQNRELDNAYEYAMTLIRTNATDISSWDTLGRVIAAREGVQPALELLERVGGVAEKCSCLFEHLGDLYVNTGNKKMAIESYNHAIGLSDDGLVIVPVIKQKLRLLK